MTMFALGLILWAAGGIMLTRLVYQHFGSTGLWFLGAWLLAQIGIAFMKEGS